MESIGTVLFDYLFQAVRPLRLSGCCFHTQISCFKSTLLKTDLYHCCVQTGETTLQSFPSPLYHAYFTTPVPKNQGLYADKQGSFMKKVIFQYAVEF